MNTQPQIIRVPPAFPPPTRNASAFFEPGQPGRPSGFWREVLGEMQQVRWLRARDVAARTLVAVGLMGFLTLFAGACATLARALTGA